MTFPTNFKESHSLVESKLPNSKISVERLRLTKFVSSQNIDTFLITNCNPIFLYSRSSKSWYKQIRHTQTVGKTYSKLLSYSHINNYTRLYKVFQKSISKKHLKKHQFKVLSAFRQTKKIYLSFSILTEDDELMLLRTIICCHNVIPQVPIELEVFVIRPSKRLESLLYNVNIQHFRTITLPGCLDLG